jgi:hypothetical protein
VAGGAFLILSAIFSDGLGIGIGLLLGLISIGALGFRVFYRLDRISKETAERMHTEIERAHERKLDMIRVKLASDNDRRDEQLFDSLRELERVFRRDNSWTKHITVMLAARTLARFDSIFENSLDILDRAFDLRQSASRLPVSAREKLLEKSAKLLDVVENSINELGKIYAQVQDLSVARMTGASQAEGTIRSDVAELNALLESAAAAEERSQAILSGEEFDASEYDTYAAKSPA